MATITEQDVHKAEQRLHKRLQTASHALAAHYDAASGRLRISLDSGVELAVPSALLQGLEHASDADLAELELSPTGLGLHFPRLDADVYIPALVGD